MQYLEGIINTNAHFSSLEDGLFMVKTALSLGIAKCDVQKMHKGDIQHTREDAMTAQIVHKYGATAPETAHEVVGEEIRFRRQAKCSATGTVYGKAQKYRLNGRKHSYFGLNKEYITSDGLPNEMAIVKRLRELGVASDVKEARYGRLYNAVFASDYYDNATALLYKMVMHYHTMTIAERLPTHMAELSFSSLDVAPLAQLEEEERNFELVRSLVMKGTTGVGCGRDSDQIFSLMAELRNWHETLPDKWVLEANGKKTTNPAYSGAKYTKKVRVWKMYEYDDGHSKSGNKYGSHFGFVNGKFLVPDNIGQLSDQCLQYLAPYPSGTLTQDQTVDHLQVASGYVNLSGFSQLEVNILNKMLLPHRRTTPFLVDQDLDLKLDDVRKVYVHGGVDVNRLTGQYTAKQLYKVIVKFVLNHRLHEDLQNALVSMKYWLAQPANETVESHWWTHLSRTLTLPELGLKRAAFHFMLQDEGVATSVNAFDALRRRLRLNDGALLESLMANTSWYWGEYMLIHNAPTIEEILDRSANPKEDIIHPLTRADAMYSAVIGRAVPKPASTVIHTCINGNLEDYKNKRIPFGPISIQHLEDYGYRLQDNNTYILDSMVCPAGLALITGLGGDLLHGTPYGAMFTMHPAVMAHDGRQYRAAMNYNDLWAYGVVNRWQGYSVAYLHPNKTGEHVMYSANNVTIAEPPVNPTTASVVCSYPLLGVRERSKVFGSCLERLSSTKTTFYWTRMTTISQEHYDWNAYPAEHDQGTQYSIRTFSVVQSDIERFTTALVAKYDRFESDFHISEQTAGVPLPAPSGTSAHIVYSTAQTTDDNPPPSANQEIQDTNGLVS